MEDIYTAEETQPYVSGRSRNERLSRIEQISKTVFSGSVMRNGTYLETALSQMGEAMDNLRYVGLDVDNMSKIEKVAWNFATVLGLTSPYKRIDKKKQKLERVAVQLEAIVQKSEKDSYHPTRGLYSELANTESQRDQSIELRDLSIAEIEDLQLERKELQQMYINGEFGPDKKYETREEVRKQGMELKRAYRKMSRLKRNTNLTILGSDKKPNLFLQVYLMYHTH